VVSVPAIGPKIRGFKHDREQFLRVIKILSTTSIGGKEKLSQYFTAWKGSSEILFYQNSWKCLAKFLLLRYKASAANCQTALVDE
jgi:hypothetical protein